MSSSLPARGRGRTARRELCGCSPICTWTAAVTSRVFLLGESYADQHRLQDAVQQCRSSMVVTGTSAEQCRNERVRAGAAERSGRSRAKPGNEADAAPQLAPPVADGDAAGGGLAGNTGSSCNRGKYGRICAALAFIGSGVQVAELLEHVENDRTEHHDSNDVHGNPPWCVNGEARRMETDCCSAASEWRRDDELCDRSQDR